MKLHIIGLAGSGKTTLAEWASLAFSMPAIDLDGVVYYEEGERPRPELLNRLDDIRSRAGWITEGAYHDDWLKKLLDDADVIVWLDIPLRRCLYRLVKRHVRAELRGDNRHPGWRRLLGFLNYTRRSAREQRRATVLLLKPYSMKVRRCRSSADLQKTKAALKEGRLPDWYC